MSNQDQSGNNNRLAPRPVSRPPVDPAATRAFGRPDGFSGSFLGTEAVRDQGDYTPTDQAPDPVLAQAFGPQNGSGDSLQRHPADAGALDAERDGDSDWVNLTWGEANRQASAVEIGRASCRERVCNDV